MWRDKVLWNNGKNTSINQGVSGYGIVTYLFNMNQYKQN